MQKESYQILKEINSLYLAATELEKNIHTEEMRLDKIKSLRRSREEEMQEDQELIQTKTKDLTALENSLATFSSQIKQAKANVNNVFTEQEVLALDKQIQLLEQKIEENENQGLALLEAIEEKQATIEDAQVFLQGSQETLTELTLEIDELTAPKRAEINTLIERQDALLPELPEHIRVKYLNLLKKNLKYGPLTSIEKGHCRICGMAIPKLEEQQIEKSLSFKQCQTCSRVFVPISSLY